MDYAGTVNMSGEAKIDTVNMGGEEKTVPFAQRKSSIVCPGLF